MDDLSAILASILSSGTFNEMLRRATPVALAAIGGSLTEHAGIMNIGMDGMILMVAKAIAALRQSLPSSRSRLRTPLSRV